MCFSMRSASRSSCVKALISRMPERLSFSVALSSPSSRCRSRNAGRTYRGKAAHRQHDQRDRQHRQQRQLPVHGKQHGADADQRQHVDQHVGDGVGDQLLEHVRVVDHPRHQLAGLLVLVEAQREALQMLVDVLTHVCHDAPTGHVRLVGADELQARTHNVKAQQQKRQPRHERHGLRVPDSLVRNRPDQIPDDPGHQQLHPDQQRHADHGEGERHDVAAAIGQKKLQSSHSGILGKTDKFRNLSVSILSLVRGKFWRETHWSRVAPALHLGLCRCECQPVSQSIKRHRLKPQFQKTTGTTLASEQRIERDLHRRFLDDYAAEHPQQGQFLRSEQPARLPHR